MISGGGDPSWLREWLRADSRVADQWEKALADSGKLTGYHLANAVLDSLAGGSLVLGNSNPVRDADLAPIRDTAGGAVYANRGLGGIDGTLATAIGIALRAGTPTTLLCGDLSFLHDSNALAIGPGEPRPDLRIVVADDHGGSIFATLEYGQPRFAAVFERVFATSVPTDLVALAQSHGIPACRTQGLPEARRLLAEPCQGIEVLVVEVDRSARAQLTAQAAVIAESL
jgi:2-succinyl-5-enolpyruvyl-6-hydroxy-3-cyclohexene-1-carboxylate synthase